MSCVPSVTVTSDSAVLVVGQTPISATAPEGVIELVVQAARVEARVDQADTIVIEVGTQGPTGPQGPVQDLIFPIKPDATLSYDPGSGQLIRVDYADATYKDLVYTNGLLTRVQGVNGGGDVWRKDLGYTGGRLTSTTTTINP